MTYRLILFLALFALHSIHSSAQDRLKFIAVETGIDMIGCNDVDKPYIRSEEPDFYSNADDYHTPVLQSRMFKTYGGVKVEVRSLNDKFGILTGLRFTRLASSITKNGSPDYFYFLHQQTGTTTEYLRVKDLSQITSYIGIPVEVRFFPYKQRRFRLYMMAGGEVSFRLGTKNDVTFKSSSMDQYKSDASAIVGRPGTISSTFYGKAGFTIGKEKPWINIGITAPLVISSSSSSLTSPTVGAGFHLQIQKQF